MLRACACKWFLMGVQISAGNSIPERHKRGCSGYHTSKFATSEPKVQLVHRRSCKGGNYNLSWKQPEYRWHSFTDLGVRFRNRRLCHSVRYSLQQMKFFSCSMIHVFIIIYKLMNHACHMVIKADPWHFDVDFWLFCSVLQSCFVSCSTDWHLYCDNSAGDDCISIQMGTNNLIVRNIECGPGHGVRYVQTSCPTSLIIQSWFDVTYLLCILHICICSR